MNSNDDKYNNVVGPQVRAPRTKSGRTIPALAALSALAGLSARRNFSRMNFNIRPASARTFSTCMGVVHSPLAIKWHRVYPEAIVRAGSIGILPTGLGLMTLDG